MNRVVQGEGSSNERGVKGAVRGVEQAVLQVGQEEWADIGHVYSVQATQV
jgi:hypothetical protein